MTRLFYDSGWSGVNIEPGPSFTALQAARTRDVNLNIAISADAGKRELWVTHPDPGLSSLRKPEPEQLPEGFTAASTQVAATTLEDVLAKYAPSRSIDFLKIDVEGAERSVLASIDLTARRPTVVIVEAISPLEHVPSHEEWEFLLLDADYLFAAFDGINRFYVPSEHADLIPTLAYPVSVLDRYEAHDVAAQRAELIAVKRERDRVVAELTTRDASRTEAAARDAQELVRQMQATLSWRVTRPLRTLRRVQRSLLPSPQSTRAEKQPEDLDTLHEEAFVHRIGQVVAALTGHAPPDASTLDVALEDLERLLPASRRSASVAAWMCLAAADGAYPDEDAVDAATRLLRSRGQGELVEVMRRRFERSIAAGEASYARLGLIDDHVVVDASHTVTTDHHTGIQRVVRETLSRWVSDPTVRLAVWDDEARSLLLLGRSEAERMREWRGQMNESGAAIASREPGLASDDVLVPLDCHLIVPEIPHPARSRGLRSLVRAGVQRRLSIIGFDLIPIVGAETMAAGMTATFCEYLSVVKYADRLSAISDDAAGAFRAFNQMLAIEGIEGPDVEAQPLPTEVPEVTDSELVAARVALEVGHTPVVLVVGSHEPRKNHLAILEAAERLWRSGCTFELLMIGGSEWRFDEFRAYAERLRNAGFSITIRKRVTDAELWAAYRIARFSVFPSLLEGYGLPVAESLASGTPVITSSHGSMAEIAAAGGALLVDPRNVDELEEQMRRLLTDDELLERLRAEARVRNFGSWDDYARDVWDFFTEESDAAVGSAAPSDTRPT